MYSLNYYITIILKLTLLQFSSPKILYEYQILINSQYILMLLNIKLLLKMILLMRNLINLFHIKLYILLKLFLDNLNAKDCFFFVVHFNKGWNFLLQSHRLKIRGSKETKPTKINFILNKATYLKKYNLRF